MADLNALIAQGYQFQAPPDPFAQYAKMQQLDVGEQTNQLNRMKMQEYQRGMEEQNQLRQLYATPGIDQNSQEFSRRMAAISPTAYQAHVKSVQEGKKSAADIGLAEARTLEAGAGTAQKKQQLAKDQRDFVKDSLSSLSFNPSDANITAFAEDAVLMKHLTPEQAQAKKDQLLAMPIDQRRIYLAQQGMSTADTAKLFESKPVEKTDGQTKWMEETNPRLPTFGQRMAGAPTVQMKATPGENLTAGTAASSLAFQKQKFEWEKDNPGYELKDDADGNLFAINKKTLKATPIMVGGAAPATAAPAAAAAPAGGGRGSVGVTDGGRTAPTAGVPFVSKTAALTESQGNATGFGIRMKDSHAALKDLENKGMTNTGVIGSTVGGVVGLVPLIGDKLASGVDNIYNVLPQVLGGYSPEQQQVLNGRINFITAVLRKESGASINPNEFTTMEKLYFPRPGDDASLIKQKQNARELAIKAMKVQAGPGAKSIDQLGVGGAGTPSANDPLGLR
jgi:hypothetical protein